MNITLEPYPPEGFILVPGKCPNEGQACNCIGACAPRFVHVDSLTEAEKIVLRLDSYTQEQHTENIEAARARIND